MDILKISKIDCSNLRSEIKFHEKFNHKNIIKFHDCLQIHNMVYLLLEYAPNGSLFPYIHPINGLPEILALRFLYQTANGIKYLHDRKIIHRDLKPENLLLDEGFNIKICDFGWSCYLEDNQVRTTVCGTYEYMSPEIVNEKFHTNKVDIWGLGILLYEMIHGKAPFLASSLDMIKKEINNKNVIVYKNVSEDVKDLIFCLLRTNEEERFDIESLLKHKAILGNLEHFERPLTKDEYDILLTNFYYSEYRVKPEDLKSLKLSEKSKNLKKEEKLKKEENLQKLKIEESKIVKEQNIIKIKVIKDNKEKLVSVKINKNLLDLDKKMRDIKNLIKKETPKISRRNSLSILSDLKKQEKNDKNYLFINFSKNNFLKKKIILLALENRFNIHPSGRILLLERKINWEKNFYEIEKKFGITGQIFFVIFFDDILNLYKINSIKVLGEKNSVRKLLGKIYRGKKNLDLQKLTNLNDFIMCHKYGLFATTKSLHSAILVSDLSFG